MTRWCGVVFTRLGKGEKPTMETWCYFKFIKHVFVVILETILSFLFRSKLEWTKRKTWQEIGAFSLVRHIVAVTLTVKFSYWTNYFSFLRNWRKFLKLILSNHWNSGNMYLWSKLLRLISIWISGARSYLLFRLIMSSSKRFGRCALPPSSDICRSSTPTFELISSWAL